MSRSNIVEVTNLQDLKEIMESCVTVIMGFTTPHTSKELKIVVRKFLKRKAEQFPLITFVYMEVSDENRTTLNILRGGPEDYPKIFHIRDGNNFLVAVNAATEETIYESFAAAEQFYIKEMKEFQKKIRDAEMNTKKGKNKKNDVDVDTPISDRQYDDRQHDDCEISMSDDSIPKKQFKTKKSSKECTVVDEDEIIDNDKNKTQTKGNNMVIQTEEPLTQLTPAMEKKKNLEKLVLLNKMSDEFKLDLIKDITKRKKLESILEKKKAEENKVDDSKEYRRSVRKNK